MACEKLISVALCLDIGEKYYHFTTESPKCILKNAFNGYFVP